mgnify:FL=1
MSAFLPHRAKEVRHEYDETRAWNRFGHGCGRRVAGSPCGRIRHSERYGVHGQGPSVMGLDKTELVKSDRRLSMYVKRMNRPWSAEAFHDEGPAHMTFLDSYLIDTYEVANKDYGKFIRTIGHPAPASWDDPRLNTPRQPVVGVNGIDAKSYCEFRGKCLPTEAEWEMAAHGPNGNLYPWGNDVDSDTANYDRHHEATLPVDSHPEGAIRSTHRFWNHPLNNSYGVGLGFRCAKNAPSDWEQRIRDSNITA